MLVKIVKMEKKIILRSHYEVLTRKIVMKYIDALYF